MKIENIVKNIGFGLGMLGLMTAPSAFAQTPVSASVHISGSCPSCDLSDRSMPRLSLQGSDFSNSSFSRSNLSGGKFHGSNLAGATFQKAYLMRVEGEGVNMRGAVLRDASLIEAKLKTSDISLADLRRADLTRGDFTGSHFLVSNFISADAIDGIFISTNFAGAKLNHSDFTNANFTKAIFENVEFGDAIMHNANFTETNLRGANLEQVQGLTQKQLDGACGDESTKLPRNLHIQNCQQKRDSYLDTILSAPLQLTSQSKENIFFLSNSQQVIAKKARRAARTADIDLVLGDLEAAIQLLPNDSPARSSLFNAQILLRNMQHSEAAKPKP